jgi:hypothetical protein
MQGETGRQAGMHTEAWRQKLAGKGRETGSQTEASKQAGKQSQAFRSRKAEAGMQAIIDADNTGRHG